MTGYFLRLAYRSGLAEKHDGGYVRPVQRAEQSLDQHDASDEIAYVFAEPGTAEPTPSEEETRPRPSAHPGQSGALAQEERPTQRAVDDSQRVHGPDPLQGAERYVTERPGTDSQGPEAGREGAPEPQTFAVGDTLLPAVPTAEQEAPRDEASNRRAFVTVAATGDTPRIQRKSDGLTGGAGKDLRTAEQPFLVEHTQQTAGLPGHSVAGGRAIPQRGQDVPNAGPKSPWLEAPGHAGSPPDAGNERGLTVSEPSREEPFPTARPFEVPSTGSTSRDRPAVANRRTSPMSRPVTVRIGTVSFEIQQDATTMADPALPNEAIETREPRSAGDNAGPQTQSSRLSRHYLRGY